jgi:prepilin-type N-terminal cleavage/methylation domain-containing protein/prepilin-type processing-associated H-X9-DG protein
MRNLYGRPSVNRQQSAFTLIELLVVIAIIAILAAILFPVFAQAREKARQAACMSNSKQIALGARMYMDDYDGSTPGRGRCTGSNPDPQSMGGSSFRRADDPQSAPALFNPYVKNFGVWICPSDTFTGVDLPVGVRNTYVFAAIGTVITDPAQAEEFASTTVIMHDNYSFRDYSAIGVCQAAPIQNAPLRKYPHVNKSINNTFLDGHVKIEFYK